MYWVCQKLDRSKIALQRNCKCRRNTRPKQCPGFYQKLHYQLLPIITEVCIQQKPLLRYLLSEANKDTSQWSACPEESWQGNLTQKTAWYSSAIADNGIMQLAFLQRQSNCWHISFANSVSPEIILNKCGSTVNTVWAIFCVWILVIASRQTLEVCVEKQRSRVSEEWQEAHVPERPVNQSQSEHLTTQINGILC